MLSVLIVDDEFEIREGLRKRIPWNDYGIGEVLVADDGDTALRIAQERRPDLIVTDIKMNRMSGRLQAFPEVDRAAYWPAKAALAKAHKGQRPILEEALERIGAA